MNEPLSLKSIKFPMNWLIAIIGFVFGIGMTWGIFGFRVAALEARMDAVEPYVATVKVLDERTQEINKKLDILIKQAIESSNGK